MLKRFFILIIIISSCFSLRAEGEELSVGVTNSPPFIIIEDDEITGLTIDLWSVISDSMNIDYHFVQNDFNDVMTNIYEGEVNISIAPMAINSSHADSTFFSQPFYITSMCVAVENHYESGFVTIVKNLFSLSFLKTIGLLLFINLCIGILIWIAERKKNPAFSDKMLSGIVDGFWWSWVTMTTVGYGDKSPLSKNGKILGTIWMLVAILIISGFTATISSELTTKRLQNNVTNIHDLHKMKVGCLEGRNTAIYLDYKHIKHKQYDSFDAAFEALEKGEINALVDDGATLSYYFKKKEKDMSKNVTLIELPNNKEYYCFMSSQPYLVNRINPYLLGFLESEQWNRLLRKYGLSE
ncbi:MAG: transporter substrate-binding domain-containing protein [Bacteroidales bacterium]|nr:transporter substrate-binding domain-containing protein [Bacteroidales bacterium]